MIKDIYFLDIPQMKAWRPALDTAVISILDSSESAARPRLAGFRSVLQLEFEDTYEEMKLANPGDWPDNPTPAEHSALAQGRGERIPTLADAQKIVQFLERVQRLNEALTLVVHCYGGISRSAAVASWAATRYWIPIMTTNKTTEYANPRLIRLLNKAAGRY